MKKLHISLIFSKLVVTKPLITIITLMHNFIVKFGKILDIFKEFAGNRVNDLGNVPRRGVAPRFSDLEVLALSATAEVFGIDGENYLFHRLKNECADRFPNLITRRQYNQRRKLTYCLGEEIRKKVPYRLNQKNWRPPIWAYKRFRKRIETLFSQLNDQFMMIRNYAKQPKGLFTRIAAKVSALTIMQYVNYVNHRKIGQVKYALI